MLSSSTNSKVLTGFCSAERLIPSGRHIKILLIVPLAVSHVVPPALHGQHWPLTPFSASFHAGHQKGEAAATPALLPAAWLVKSGQASTAHRRPCPDSASHTGTHPGCTVPAVWPLVVPGWPLAAWPQQLPCMAFPFLKDVITEVLPASLIRSANMSTIRAFRDWLRWTQQKFQGPSLSEEASVSSSAPTKSQAELNQHSWSFF